MTLPFTRAAWRPLCSAAVLGLSLIHIFEPTRLRCTSYAVFCLKKKRPIDRNFKIALQLIAPGSCSLLIV
ncbi:hypothetical protein KZ847_17095, partial [Pseudomonas aeruginosa]